MKLSRTHAFLAGLCLMPVAATSALAQHGPSGSGAADMTGRVIHYEYDDFGGFRLHMREDGLKWRGVNGTFKDVVALVQPVVSVISDGVYFMSWPTREPASDNVVVNFNEMTVNAHLGGNNDYNMITGVVYCVDTPDCLPPEGEPMEQQQIMQTVGRNMQAAGIGMGMGGMGSGGMGPRPAKPPSAADLAAWDELAGKEFKYSSDYGDVTVQVAGEETIVTDNSGTNTFKSYATRVGDGVYFVSWDGENGGNHVVFNSNTSKAYDQIDNVKIERREMIYDVSCFAEVGSC